MPVSWLLLWPSVMEVKEDVLVADQVADQVVDLVALAEVSEVVVLIMLITFILSHVY